MISAFGVYHVFSKQVEYSTYEPGSYDAHVKGKNVGYLDTEKGAVKHIKVKRKFRRQGIGTGLMSHAESVEGKPIQHTSALSRKGAKFASGHEQKRAMP